MADPRSSGYFVSVTVDPELNRAGAQTRLRELSSVVDRFVAPIPEIGERVAAVGVGLGPRFFVHAGAPRFDPPLQTPAAFAPDASPLPNVPGQSIAADSTRPTSHCTRRLPIGSMVIVAFIMKLHAWRDGNPRGSLRAIGGLTYVAATTVFRIV
jgi:hypothetical protein